MKAGRQMGIQERKERERERRRQQIIVAAKKVFSEKGFNKATMDDIAGEAELSPGTLYLYFKNKEELYLVVANPAVFAYPCGARCKYGQPGSGRKTG